ncbi:YciI family protein [Massilia jejuensis]|uniref:YciI family protein n=1 Tax=Massilia jejuensis TaxID=648894 RepID=A0ABW0PGY5_9BURK
MRLHALALATLLALPFAASANPAAPAPAVAYDAELARSLGADERGMRPYVLVILKTGPRKMAAGDERNAMFKGHFANIGKLAGERKLVLAGPLDGKEGRRGIFVLNTPDIDTARTWVALDPVIIHGEMEAEYHKFYGSAALMTVNEVHARIEKK